VFTLLSQFKHFTSEGPIINIFKRRKSAFRPFPFKFTKFSLSKQGTVGYSDFNRSRRFRWLWMPFKTLRHIYKKGYFNILRHSFLIWLQSFNKLHTNKTLQKNCFKKFDISKKNADFYAEFKYEKWTANNFSQKSYKQKKGRK